jgi:hypothetical protein
MCLLLDLFDFLILIFEVKLDCFWSILDLSMVMAKSAVEARAPGVQLTVLTKGKAVGFLNFDIFDGF